MELFTNTIPTEIYDKLDEEGRIKAVIYAHYFDSGVYEVPEDIDMVIYQDRTMRDLAEEFIDDGVFGDIPIEIENYIDYNKVADDLRFDYTQVIVDGESVIYRAD